MVPGHGEVASSGIDFDPFGPPSVLQHACLDYNVQTLAGWRQFGVAVQLSHQFQAMCIDAPSSRPAFIEVDSAERVLWCEDKSDPIDLVLAKCKARMAETRPRLRFIA